MANEIYTNTELVVRKNGATISAKLSKNKTMAGDDMMQNTQVVGTTSELVGFGDITGAPAEVHIQNLDTTNFVEIGGDSGLTVFKIKILAGCDARFQPSSATMYAKADTAAVRVLITAVEA